MTPYKKTSEISSQDLAYLGDAVLEVMVRRHLVLAGHSKEEHLSDFALEYVTATAQSAAYEKILPLLTEREADVIRRGRNNYHTGNVPKSATPGQYRRATAFEALFGYLYLENDEERMRFLFEAAYETNTSINTEGKD